MRFREEVTASLEAARGTYIYDACVRDLDDKTSPLDPCGYQRWLRHLLTYCAEHFQTPCRRILDFGSGNGEFTVVLNLMGYDTVGVEVNDRALGLARLLAAENDLDDRRFVKGVDRRLPFPDAHFDIALMISSLEHIDDSALQWIVPELARVCDGPVCVQVPSAMKLSDDHTGLKFVPWMPAWAARLYIGMRGPRYRYLTSQSGEWDVVYRNLDEVERAFSSRYEMHLLPREQSFPPCGPEHAVLDLRKSIQVGSRTVSLRVPLLWRRLKRLSGKRTEHFLPYYNVVFVKRCA